MKIGILAVALTMVFFAPAAMPDDVLSPKIEIEDRPESSVVIYRTPLQSETIDQLTYEWQLRLFKPRDGTTPPTPTMEFSITSHNVNVAFVVERVVVDGGEELYLSYGGSETGCTKMCEYIETRAVQIPFAILHKAMSSGLRMTVIGQRTAKIVEIPSSTIQEFLKRSGT